MTYRGFEFNKFTGITDTGMRTWRGARGEAHTAYKFKKIKGYVISLPDGGTKFCSTVKETKKYIDAYLGD